MAIDQKLGELADALEARGADELRVQVVRRAREFKRSWVMMAEALVEVRNLEAYVKWGYDDFYSYCSLELHIKRTTADKLTGSYIALKRHAPAVLKRDGLSERIPTYDAVDYFAKALQKDDRNATIEQRAVPEEVVDELRHAVFEEGAPVTELRRRFNPVFHPKPEGAEQIEEIRRALTTARKLERQIEEIDGLHRPTVRAALDSLEALREDLVDLLDRTKATYARTG
jgi:DNA-binding transcriptional ArsR family regulator